MKRVLFTIAFVHSMSILSGQNNNIRLMVDSLKDMNSDTLDCSADLYWRIIAKGEDAIPFLIEKLTDTTQTNVKWHCKKTRLNVGEVANFALNAIGEFPAYFITRIQFDLIYIDETGQSCWTFYDYFFDNANKPTYQQSVRSWYEKEKGNYKKERITGKRLTDCEKKFGVTAYYRWSK